MLFVEALQAAAGSVQRGVIERGGGVGVDVWAWVQAEPTEQPLLI
jgi:hypothetical protein